MSLEISAAARDDLDAILSWSLENFGEKAQTRYVHLLEVALTKISNEQDFPGLKTFEALQFYHLRHCKHAAPIDGTIVNSPRHILVFRQTASTTQLVRILHDAMDFERHLPDSAKGQANPGQPPTDS